MGHQQGGAGRDHEHDGANGGHGQHQANVQDDADELDETLTDTICHWITEFNVTSAKAPPCAAYSISPRTRPR